MGAIHPQVATSIVAAAFALTVIFVRLRASRKPTSVRKIIAPSAGMATGFLMFFFAPMRIPVVWGIIAFAAGALIFAFPLIQTSKFHMVDGQIYLKRSKSFIFILLGLLVIRLILHNYVEDYITVPQTGAVFFILAFGMLLPWRLAMLRQFLKLRNEARMKA